MFWKKGRKQKKQAPKPKKYKPVVLLVLDGFGVNPEVVDSPWCLAKRPNFKELEKFWPFLVLQASGLSVGLPWSEPGNSEVGHLTMGSGRVIYTALARISQAIEDGSFFANPALLQAMERAKLTGSSLHLIGLFSSGTVHAYFEHFFAVLELAKRQGVARVFLHLFTDGKDSPKQEAGEFLEKQGERLANDYPAAKIVSLIGRNFAMDREGRWDLTESGYRLLVEGKGVGFRDPVNYLKEEYLKGRNDENIEPGFLVGEGGNPEARIKNGDAIIFMNFREDSSRQLTKVFVDKDFQEFEREELDDLLFVTMTEYDKKLKTAIAFPQPEVNLTLGELVSAQGLKQLRIAETVKYAHVTYFFNGGKEKPLAGEERILIPSLKDVRPEEAPEMQAEKICQAMFNNLAKYDFILANFANVDMVGHTGNFKASIKAFEVLDKIVGEIKKTVLAQKGVLLVTGDHGNAEEKRYPLTGEPRTEHTLNPVPFYLITEDCRFSESTPDDRIRKNYLEIKGTLTDIAPTILELMGLEKPKEMTGKSLFKFLISNF